MTAPVLCVVVSLLLGQNLPFICPMHPEISADAAISCRRCGMTLVPRANPAAREYEMHVKAVPTSRGLTRFEFEFRRSDGSPADNFYVLHERELHVFLVRRDQSFFDHVHPVRIGPGRYVLDTPLPGPAEYMVFADFQPADNNPHLLQQLVRVSGARSGKSPVPVARIGPTSQVVEGMRITLRTEVPRAGEPAQLHFILADAVTGNPITDLVPYLASPGHLFFADTELQAASHSHPLWDEYGPDLRFEVRFTRASAYRLWLQVQRGETVVTSEWAIDVPSR